MKRKPRKPVCRRRRTSPDRIQFVPLACGGLLMRNLDTGLVARVR